MRRMNYLVACLVAVITFTTVAVNAQQEVLHPDLMVRRLEFKSKSVVTVFVLNKGKADAAGCYLTLSGMDSSGTKWSQRYNFDGVAQGATYKMEFGISPNSAGPGTSILAVIDSGRRLDEVDETNNSRELRLPDEVPSDAPVKLPPIKISPPPPTPAPTPKPAPPPAPETQLVSPDIAAAGIYYKDGFVVGTLKNVGERDYYNKNFKHKDSFKRPVSLKRIVHVGGTSYTENVGTRWVPDLSVGQTFNYAFPRPKNIAGATKYIWILTIEGEDANLKNNTFKDAQTITKID
jgi:hypothetical protein